MHLSGWIPPKTYEINLPVEGFWNDDPNPSYN